MKNTNRIYAPLVVCLYILSIVAANALTNTFGLIPIGFDLMVTAGTFAAGFAFVLRDGVQTLATRPILYASIVVGSIVSAVTSTPQLAIASGMAFFASELVDTAAFSRLRSNIPLAVVVSSLVAAPVDTLLFLHLAGFPVTWQAVIGQIIVKTILALLVAMAIVERRRRAVFVRM